MTTADRSVIGEAGPDRAGASSTPLSAASRLRARGWAAALEAIAAKAAGQAGRLALWAPVAFGAGCAEYFALPVEPPVWAAWLAAAVAAAALAFRRLSAWGGGPLLLLACLSAGCADGKLATEWSRAPVLPDGLGVVRVAGRVVDIADVEGGRLRLLLQPASIEGVAPPRLPTRIRLTLREPADVEPGDAIATRAILNPPPGPASPGGFDFARDAWFARLGGVGLALTPLRPTALAPMRLPLRLQTGLNTLRWRLAERLQAAVGGGEAGGLAAAVSTSHQAWLSEAAAQDLRDSGLAHMLAIAGLHTAAVAGFVYVAVRLAVAAWPWLALRVSGKKLAAAAGLLACLAYLALSGAHPPARRAAATASIAFLAILTGRRPISLHSLALAALVVLALQPVAVVQPGFQTALR